MNSERFRASTRREPSWRWWWAAAWAQSSAIFEKGSFGFCSSMKRIASCAFGVSQNVRMTRSARERTTRFLIRLTIVYHHEPTDMIHEEEQHAGADESMVLDHVAEAQLLQGFGVVGARRRGGRRGRGGGGDQDVLQHKYGLLRGCQC